MNDQKRLKSPLTIRERLVVWLIILVVKIVAPWEYDHEFTKLFNEIVKLIQGEEVTNEG